MYICLDCRIDDTGCADYSRAWKTICSCYCFQLNTTAMTYIDARWSCEQQGAELASIENELKQACLQNMFTGNEFYLSPLLLSKYYVNIYLFYLWHRCKGTSAWCTRVKLQTRIQGRECVRPRIEEKKNFFCIKSLLFTNFTYKI